MTCPRCDNENPTDYPVCGTCAKQAHFAHRAVCMCDVCATERDLAWLAATRAKSVAAHSHMMALHALSVAFSDDPAMLVPLAA